MEFSRNLSGFAGFSRYDRETVDSHPIMTNFASSLRIGGLMALALFLGSTANAAVTEKVTHTFPLSAKGTVSLSNVNGSIEIEAWDKNEVFIEAEKKAKNADALGLITLEFDARPERLAIKTVHAKKSGLFNLGSQGSVSYKLKVPAGTNLDEIDTTNSNVTVRGVRGKVEIDTTNGSIKATGLAGDTQLDSTNGNISAEFVSLDGVREIDLDTTNGSVTLVLPRGAAARIHAETTNGSINVEPQIKLTRSGKREILGEIGSGGPSVELETTNGGISVFEAN